jgi:AcrR family transcriptional regulator
VTALVTKLAVDIADDIDIDLRLIVPQGLVPPSRIPADVFASAADSYVSGQRLDMQALARRLGVGRATLYRRAGNREQLLDEVIWWRSRHALVGALRRSAGQTGVARIVSVVGGVLQAVERDTSLRSFLETDPEVAMRILTGTRSTVQHGMTTALEMLLHLENERGHFVADIDTPTLAYTVVRINEGFLYSDIIADRPPDIDRAIKIIDALLTGLDSASRE